MTGNKKITGNTVKRIALITLLAALLFTCEKMPEYCGDGYSLNSATQFCHAGVSYNKCSGAKYDPENQQCDDAGVLKERCPGGDDFFNSVTEFCAGGKKYELCDNKEFNPTNQTCEAGVIKTRCPGGTDYINPATEFCSGGDRYVKCNGNNYNPANQTCDIGIVKDRCGSSYFDPVTEFCDNGNYYTKCGGNVYDPLTQICMAGEIYTLCGEDEPVPAGTPCGGHIHTLYTGAVPEEGGTVYPATKSYPIETLVGVTATAAQGYKFIRWDGASESTNPIITVTMDRDKQLVAIFEQIITDTTDHSVPLTTTVTPGNSGTITRNPNRLRYDPGTLVTVTATPEDHYRFTGWSGSETSTSSSIVITMNGPKSLIANFERLTYTLTTPEATGGTVTRNLTQASYTAGTIVTVTATPADGYEFTSWSGASSSTNTTVPVTMDGNKELVANFRLIPTYTLTVNPNTTAGGTVTPASPQTGITAGTQVTVTATENFGYRFTNWTVATGNATFGNANNATTTVSLSSNATIRANFELICYTLTINRNPTAGGTVTPSPANSAGCPSGTYTVGASVTVTQTSNTGYRFTGWVGAATGTSNSVTVIMNSDLTLTANYIRQFTLTISRNMTNGGTVLVNNVSYTVPTTHDSGAVVNITATPSNVHGFWKWLGVNSHSAASTVTMHSDQSITANFKGGYFNQAISYGSFIDPRDGQSYRIIHINGRTWMAENINYNIPLSTANVCNNNDENNCAKYGRLYYWFEAKNYACPDGWRFSTGDDWGTLVNFAGGPDVAGKKLKAKTGWPSGGNGTDDYGFSAVPGGLDNSEAGEGGYWWTDEEYGNDTERAYRRGMGSGDGMWRNHEGRGRKHSVRCVRN